jgi:hypothetical protein
MQLLVGVSVGPTQTVLDLALSEALGMRAPDGL